MSSQAPSPTPQALTRLRTEIRPGVHALVTIQIVELRGNDPDFCEERIVREPNFTEVHEVIRNIEGGDCRSFDQPEDVA